MPLEKRCVFPRFEESQDGPAIHRYTCDQVKVLQSHWKNKFREVNKTDEVQARGRVDRPYQEYCKSIDDFLSQCKCPQKTDDGEY